MTTKQTLASSETDPAAVFACADSLWRACEELAAKEKFHLSECFNGIDQLMRDVMAIANRFEKWSCRYVDFEEFTDVWPYLLQDRFGKACLDCCDISELTTFNDDDCLRVAIRLELPIPVDSGLPVPIDLTAPNPCTDAGFRDLRIQTVRDSLQDDDVEPFVAADDPFDGEHGEPYFALYGVGPDGALEYIADRATYGELLTFTRKLLPGIAFPEKPIFGAKDGQRP